MATKPEKTINIGLRLPESWLVEIDDLIARRFPHRTRSEWARGVVEQELIRQRDVRNEDVRLDRILTLVEEVYGAVVKGDDNASN